VVVAAFAASVVLLPRADVPIGDDWVYARSVWTLLDGGGLVIEDASVVTLVAQVVWGSLFAWLWEPTFVALRYSTATAAAGGAVAVYLLCRLLGAGRSWAAVGAALWLFNPLNYVLANSYMTDSTFAALLAIAAYFYVRGLGGWCLGPPPAAERPVRGSATSQRYRSDAGRPPRSAAPNAKDTTLLGVGVGWVVAGSAASAVAFLVRQQGLLIPLAVLAYLWLSRRSWGRAGRALVVPVAAVPALTAALYWAWLALSHGVPGGQRMFSDELSLIWRAQTPRFLGELAAVQLLYAGLFVLPVAAAAALAGPRLARGLPPRGRRWLIVVLGVVATGALALTVTGRYMPYVPQYLASWGLGPADVQGGRPEVVSGLWLWVLTAVVVMATAVGAALVVRRLAGPEAPGGPGAGLLLVMLVAQAGGAVPASLHFQNPGGIMTITMDRYLLPLLPLALCLAVWAAAGLRVPSWPAWGLVAVLAVVSVAGARDLLVLQRTIWEVAAAANRAGVEDRFMDAGAQWNGERLHRDFDDLPPPDPERVWWLNLFAPQTDPQYVVSTLPLPGYVEVSTTTYRTWLPPRDNPLLFLRRHDVAPRPGAAP
jgi:hypothetical protein